MSSCVETKSHNLKICVYVYVLLSHLLITLEIIANSVQLLLSASAFPHFAITIIIEMAKASAKQSSSEKCAAISNIVVKGFFKSPKLRRKSSSSKNCALATDPSLEMLVAQYMGMESKENVSNINATSIINLASLESEQGLGECGTNGCRKVPVGTIRSWSSTLRRKSSKSTTSLISWAADQSNGTIKSTAHQKPDAGLNNRMSVASIDQMSIYSLTLTTRSTGSGEESPRHPSRRTSRDGTQMSVLLIGASNCGKSAFAQRFVNGIFISRYEPTSEAHLFKTVAVDKLSVTLKIIDSGGHLMESKHHRKHYRTANAFAVIFSVLDPDSLAIADKLMEKIVSVRGNPPMILFGTKIDAPGRLVSLRKGAEIAQKHGTNYFEVSATNPRLCNGMMRLMRLAMNRIVDPDSQSLAPVPETLSKHPGSCPLPRKEASLSPMASVCQLTNNKAA